MRRWRLNNGTQSYALSSYILKPEVLNTSVQKVRQREVNLNVLVYWDSLLICALPIQHTGIFVELIPVDADRHKYSVRK